MLSRGLDLSKSNREQRGTYVFEIVVREHLNGIQIDVVLFKFDCQLRKTNVSEETADSFFLFLASIFL